MTDTRLRGRLLWYELLTSDPAGAIAFYSAVAGWGTQPFDGAPEPYTLWTKPDGRPVGGVMAIPEGMQFPSHWEMYIGSDHLDDDVREIERLGGAALSPVIDIPSVGRMRTMQDPQGAVFSLMQPSSPERTPEVQPETGDVAWHELFTTDSAAAMTFYTTMFGWTPTSDFDMGPMGTYRMFGRTFALGGMMNKPPHMAQVPPHWGLYFRVEDLDAAVGRLKAAGGQVVNGPMDVPGGARIANCLDPQGAFFSLHALPKA